ncbi:YihY/virulence factor BrkB family protein [Erythrobacter sp. WG]|uniref:YihY/virulence factor BrkB family protein n=1 Tax=Erythrobacter sp. WG TaxID=2985510 RepID=UPI002270C777|nr:YihY/virulence factor BrkB family protein [Erythrobacter sp. WG]MCX9147996.1 YihY/virulence factor BrkB family protein [Erythrobacter sp. WG]
MTDQTRARGEEASSPWEMPIAAWKDVLVRTYREASADNVGHLAAGAAFYSFLALFPLLAAAVLTYGLVADPDLVLSHLTALTTMLPADVARIIGDQLLSVVETSGGTKGLGLLVALAVAIFGARNAAGAIITALNIAYEEEEKRGFLKTNLVALAITVCAVIALVIAAMAMAALGYLDALMPTSGAWAIAASKALSYALFAMAAAMGAAVLYRFGPSRERASWKWVTPGSLLFAVAWVILTLAFGFYIARFGNYGATYGSLSAVVVLLTWLYLSAYALLFGGELNAELEHQTARDTTTGPAQPMGTRGAWAADNVASGQAAVPTAR